VKRPIKRTPKKAGVSLDSAPGARALLAAIVDSSEDAIYAGDVRGRILAWNRAAERLFGYSSLEIIGQPIARLCPPGSEAEQESLMASVTAGAPPTHVETVRQRKDGSTFPVALTISSMRDARGRIIGASAIARDITERKRAEESLRESEARFRAVVENSHDGILFTDAKGTIVYRSPSYALINGYADDERVGRSGFETVHPDDLAATRQIWTAMLRDPQSVYRVQYRIKHQDGSWRLVDTAVQNLLGNPDVGAVLVTTRDISERAEAEEERRRIEQAYGAMVESARDVIFTLTPDGVVTSLNPAFATITDMPAEQWIGKPFSDLLHPEDVLLAAQRLAAAVRGEPPGPVVPLRIRRADGTYRIGEIHVVARKIGERVVSVFGIGRDVSDRIALEEQLRQAQKMEAVGRLAGGVAHDFNNVLTAITGYSDLLLEDLADEDPRRQDVVEIQAAALRAAALTRQLLAFSRKQVVQTRTLDLNNVVRTLDKMLQRLLGEDVKLEFSLSSALGAIQADLGQIEQVILNLAVNSRDAMPSGGSLRLQTANMDLEDAAAGERGVSPGPYVMLAVSDTGSGMDVETMSHIFEPFFTTKETGKGTGLGLATVYGIVKQSGGHISVASEPGRGTTFTILLPQVDKTPEDPSPAAPSQPVAGGSETVLVAEDDPSVRAVVADVLTQKGYRVLRAPDPQTALEMAQGQPERIHLLVTDLVMPGMTGRELADALMAERPGLRVLYMSGHTEDAVVRQRVLEDGAPYLQKPFAPYELASKVREVLDRA
jgi:PAS domain S-box-containing protein